jgi:hypothetical protein
MLDVATAFSVRVFKLHNRVKLAVEEFTLKVGQTD